METLPLGPVAQSRKSQVIPSLNSSHPSPSLQDSCHLNHKLTTSFITESTVLCCNSLSLSSQVLTTHQHTHQLHLCCCVHTASELDLRNLRHSLSSVSPASCKNTHHTKSYCQASKRGSVFRRHDATTNLQENPPALHPSISARNLDLT